MIDTPKEELPLEQKVGAIDSVVHQTFEDISGRDGIGEVIDRIEKDTDDIPKLRKELYSFKEDVKKQIALEVQKQMKPVNDKLDRFLTTKPKVVYIDLRLPNPIKWFTRVIHK